MEGAEEWVMEDGGWTIGKEEERESEEFIRAGEGEAVEWRTRMESFGKDQTRILNRTP